MGLMTRPWPEIAAHYEGAPAEPSIQALGSLARRISYSHLSDGMYAWVSMWDLCIVQTEVSYPYNGPYLCITPTAGDKLTFRYVDTAESRKQWTREVPSGAAWDQFMAFLRQLHWFTDLDTQSGSRGSCNASSP